MSRRLNVRPTTLLAALPLTALACASTPPPATTSTAAIVAAIVAEVPDPEVRAAGPRSESASEVRDSEVRAAGPRSESESESEVRDSESEFESEVRDSEGPGSESGAEVPSSASANCEGMPELSCRVGNTKVPTYQTDGRS